MNHIPLLLGPASLISSGFCRKFSVSAVRNRQLQCKLLVIGGGSGGCTMAAKFVRKNECLKDVIILEPSESHYYQPLWTLVGAGVKPVEITKRSMKSVLPSKAQWIKDSAVDIDPDNCSVSTANGDQIKYEHLIIAVGVVNDYDKIPRLKEALDDPNSGVSSIYEAEYAAKTWRTLQDFNGGDAVFTYPDSIIKCPGAPQKIAYLTDSYLRKRKIRNKSKIVYNTCLPVIFGVKKYADSLLEVVKRKNIEVNYRTVLKSVDPDRKEAVFYVKDHDNHVVREFTKGYDILHATPPMRTPDVLCKNDKLVDDTGYLDVDMYTLQHKRYPNIYAIGDNTNTPNSKTGAAIAKQCYVIEKNLLSTMKGQQPTEKYDGYGACPLITSYNTVILAEFLYGGVPHETFPFDQAKESRFAYYMKRDAFPFIYWHVMLKGYYHGPELVKQILNPTRKAK